MTREEIVTLAPVAEEAFHAISIGLATVPTIRRLAELQPVRLALMHGSSFVGDAAAQLTKLAETYQALAAQNLLPTHSCDLRSGSSGPGSTSTKCPFDVDLPEYFLSVPQSLPNSFLGLSWQRGPRWIANNGGLPETGNLKPTTTLR